MASVRSGIQKDYLEGLDNLRKIIMDVECEVDQVKRKYYQCGENDEDAYERYIQKQNEDLLACNAKLRKQSGLKPIDGELALVSLLNRVRDLPTRNMVPQATLDGLSNFWESTKNAIDSLTLIKDRFKTNALKRLKHICASYTNEESLTHMNLTRQYSDDVQRYEGEISVIIDKFDKLRKSFNNGLQQDLFTDSSFSNRILVSCDPKAFPILKLIPDLTEKLVKVCALSKQWIDKDETYMHDISDYIREKRSQTRIKAQDLKKQKKKRGELEKSVDDAQDVFKASKEKLARIETELRTLQEQMCAFNTTKKYKTEEIKQKEGIVGFLEISITQTKRNYTLQLKRSRLMRQLRELEESLKEIEKELSIIEQSVQEKAQIKTEIVIVVEETENSYSTVKNELNKFSQNVERLQQEVNQLTDTLTSLEIIQSVKTSPETVEDFYERPVAVKLAPSLKETILRKRKLKMVNSGNHR